MTKRLTVQEIKDKAPAYAEVADNGALWRCKRCDKEGQASEMYYYHTTPSGLTGVAHKTCFDAWWLTKATKVEGKV